MRAAGGHSLYRCMALAVWQVKLVPRFAVEQGVKQDGSVKIRAVDHFSWSAPSAEKVGAKRTRREVKAESVNGHYSLVDDLPHDHLDVLLAAMRLHVETFGSVSLPKGGIPVNIVAVLFSFRPQHHGKVTLMRHSEEYRCKNHTDGQQV